MFVKIENYFGEKPLILNVDKITSIKPQSIGLKFDENGKTVVLWDDKYEVWCDKNVCHILNEEQYTGLCKALTQRL